VPLLDWLSGLVSWLRGFHRFFGFLILAPGFWLLASQLGK